MIAHPETLIKLMLITSLLSALAPMFVYKHNSKILSNMLLLPVAGCFVQSLAITYFYIYSGRAEWVLFEVEPVEMKFHLESFGLVFLNLLTGLWCISTLYAIHHMKKVDSKNQVRFLTMIGCTIFSAILISLSQNLFTMLVGYELLTLCTIPLVAHHQFERKEVKNYVMILLTTSIGFFMPFILLTNHYASGVEFKHGGILPSDMSHMILHIMLGLMIFGIAKTAILPVHGWLTSAMIAPYPVSALLHAVAVVKAGIFCVGKVIIYIFGIDKLSLLLGDFNWPLFLFSFTLIYSSVKAALTSQIKHVLAYSTIANLALIMMAFFVLSQDSMRAGITHMIAHGFTKITLFFTAGIFYVHVKSNNLSDLKSVAYKNPLSAFLFLIAAFSLIGIKPLAGSVSKSMLWDVFVQSKYYWVLGSSFVVYSISTIYFMSKLCYLIFSRDGNGFGKITISGMEIAALLSGLCMLSFNIVERFLDAILWNIL